MYLFLQSVSDFLRCQEGLTLSKTAFGVLMDGKQLKALLFSISPLAVNLVLVFEHSWKPMSITIIPGPSIVFLVFWRCNCKSLYYFRIYSIDSVTMALFLVSPSAFLYKRQCWVPFKKVLVPCFTWPIIISNIVISEINGVYLLSSNSIRYHLKDHIFVVESNIG